jgi:acyl carrier protein
MSELITLVADILRLPVEEVDEDTGAATDPAWNSLRHVAIIVAVQTAYGVELTPRQARACRSVRTLRDVLAGKGINV